MYLQLREQLLSAIQRGEVRSGEKIPTEREFQEQLGLSRSTVRQAILDLSRSGYLTRKKGVGTVVAENAARQLEGKQDSSKAVKNQTESQNQPENQNRLENQNQPENQKQIMNQNQSKSKGRKKTTRQQKTGNQPSIKEQRKTGTPPKTKEQPNEEQLKTEEQQGKDQLPQAGGSFFTGEETEEKSVIAEDALVWERSEPAPGQESTLESPQNQRETIHVLLPVPRESVCVHTLRVKTKTSGKKTEKARIALHLSQSEPLLSLRQVISVEEKPVIYVESFVPKKSLESLKLQEGLLTEHLENAGIQVASFSCTVSADFASERVARELGLLEDCLVLRLSCTGLDEAGVPVCYSICTIDAEEDPITITVACSGNEGKGNS